MNKPQQFGDNARKDPSLLSDQELQETINRMFTHWCWISGDPDEKHYYDQLLAEMDQRGAASEQRRNPRA